MRGKSGMVFKYTDKMVGAQHGTFCKLRHRQFFCKMFVYVRNNVVHLMDIGIVRQHIGR